jgi:PhnB protein
MTTQSQVAHPSNAVKTMPEGYHTVTPWIIAKGAAKLIDYLKEGFGAQEIARMQNDDGTISHAEIKIGDSIVMLFDAKENWPETPAFFRLYVQDGDVLFDRALKAGGTSVTEMTNLAFGDRVGRVRDPFGNIWWIQTRLEELDPAEMEKRAAEQHFIEAMNYVQDTLIREMAS